MWSHALGNHSQLLMILKLILLAFATTWYEVLLGLKSSCSLYHPGVAIADQGRVSLKEGFACCSGPVHVYLDLSEIQESNIQTTVHENACLPQQQQSHLHTAPCFDQHRAL